MSRAGKLSKARTEPEAVKDAVDGEVQSEAAENAAAQTTEPEAVEDAATGHVVAEGRSVTCLKGVIGSGSAITADHLSGGQETLDALIRRGVVVVK